MWKQRQFLVHCKVSFVIMNHANIFSFFFLGWWVFFCPCSHILLHFTAVCSTRVTFSDYAKTAIFLMPSVVLPFLILLLLHKFSLGGICASISCVSLPHVKSPLCVCLKITKPNQKIIWTEKTLLHLWAAPFRGHQSKSSSSI